MQKIIAALGALAVVLGLGFLAAPVEASPYAYTRVHYEVKGPNLSITILCHDRTTGGIKYMSWGDDSFQKCPLSGWVDQVFVGSCYKLRALNYNTGVVTVYPQGYDPEIPYGYYGIWVTNVC